MIAVSEITREAPAIFQTPLQQRVYETLAYLHIPFERVDTEEVVTMADCEAVNQRLQMRMVKTLLLCNRRQTAFYLFVTTGENPFQSKACSAALGVSRLSFAPPDKLQSLLGTSIGAATIFSVLLESAREVELVLDAEVLRDASYGCSDGTTTSYLKLPTNELMDKLLPYAGRTARVIEV